jgi:hypothetical protein
MNELTQLQSLIQNGVYHIYMLLLNQVRVIAVYIYAPSWMKINENIQLNVPKVSSYKQKPKKTNGNRISALHHHISRTSTAVVKYLPPVHCPKYDAFGKRIKDGNHYAQQTDDKAIGGGGGDILRLISSIQHKSLCDSTAFMYGYYSSVSLSLATNNRKQHNTTVVCIDTLAHNYRIIDSLISSAAGTWKLLSREKWYYILYNAIIHQETMCKDILMI